MPSLIPNVESGKFSTSKKKLFQNHMNWDILQSWKIFHFDWKNFHFSENFFTLLDFQACPNSVQMKKLENFPLWWKILHFQKSAKKKKFFCRIAWIGTFCRGRKISTFGGKFSTLVKFYFQHLDLRVCQISSPIEKLEFFPLLWKIFHLQKCAPKKKKFLQNCINWKILQRWKIFQFWWKIFHFGEI